MNTWTVVELSRAHKMRSDGVPLADIGERLGRSGRAVGVKLSRFASDGTRADTRSRMTTAALVAELERRGFVCTPPEHPSARIDL